MREDFGRVVIEQARRGSRNRGLKIRKTGKFRFESQDWQEWGYDGPMKIRTNGIRGVKHAYDRKLGEKEFSDVLGPVHGYLRHSVGRRWDDVFSELTQALGRGSYPIRHVLTQHAIRYVHVNTFLENGKVYSHDNRAYGDYFVDPRDGALREEEPVKYEYKEPVYDRHYWKEGLWFVRIRCVWYLGVYTSSLTMATDLKWKAFKRPEVSRTMRYDMINEMERQYNWPNIDGSYFVKWRQAGKRDLKELRKLLTPPGV